MNKENFKIIDQLYWELFLITMKKFLSLVIEDKSTNSIKKFFIPELKRINEIKQKLILQEEKLI